MDHPRLVQLAISIIRFNISSDQALRLQESLIINFYWLPLILIKVIIVSCIRSLSIAYTFPTLLSLHRLGIKLPRDGI
jgi:hypothetical protein